MAGKKTPRKPEAAPARRTGDTERQQAEVALRQGSLHAAAGVAPGAGVSGSPRRRSPTPMIAKADAAASQRGSARSTVAGRLTRTGWCRSPARLLIILAVSTAIIEAALMVLLHSVVQLPLWLVSLVDTAVLVVLMVPLLYSFLIRPMTVVIADTRRAEEALRESEERFRSVVETASDAIICIDSKASIIFWNDAANAMFGYSADEMGGRTLTDIMPERFRAAHQRAMERVIRGGRLALVGVAREVVGLGKNGSEFPVELTLASWKTSEGVYFTGFVRDITARKQADEALRRSHELANAVIEGTSDAIYVKDLSGRYSLLNRVALQTLGLPSEEVVGKDDTAILPPDEARRVMEADRAIMQKQQPRVLEETVSIQGTQRTFLTRKHILRDYQGSVSGIIGISTDITERKQAEEAQQQYEHIVSSSTDMLALIDQRYVYLAANTAYLQAFAKTSDEVIGRTVAEVLGDEFFNTTIRPRAERCLAGENVRYQAWFEFPATGRKYMDATYAPYRGQNTKVQGFVVAARDITDRKRAEEALRKSEEGFRTLYTKTPAMVHSIDTDGNLVTVSDRWLEVLGYERSEVIGRKSIEFLTAESRQYAETVSLPKFWKTGMVRDVAYQFVKKTGEIVDVLLSAVVERDREGNMLRSLTVLDDITERKQAEEALREAREALEGRVERKLLQKNPYGLTFRELTVLHLVAAGKADKEIAHELGISPLTVHKHVANILSKMSAASRTEAGVRALREGLLD